MIVASMEGPRHARVRKLMGQAFGPRMVERLGSRIQSIVDSLLDGLDESADLVDALCSPLPTMVICELLGAPYADSADIRRMSKQIFRNTMTPDELLAAERDMQGRVVGAATTASWPPSRRRNTGYIESSSSAASPVRISTRAMLAPSLCLDAATRRDSGASG
jgi:cytochrome P450